MEAVQPLAKRTWTEREDLVSLQDMGVAYNPSKQRNEYGGRSIAELPQFLTSTDHTSRGNQDVDDYTSDI